jgi:hypothetical protein
MRTKETAPLARDEVTTVRNATKFREVTERNDSRCGSRSGERGQAVGRVRIRASRGPVPKAGPERSGGDGFDKRRRLPY